jgi:hypothetical protein
MMNAGITRGWSVWVDTWRAKTSALAKLRACGNRLRAPEVTQFFDFWRLDVLHLKAAREAFLDVVGFVAGNTKASPNAVFSGSVPYLMLAGNLVAGLSISAPADRANDGWVDALRETALEISNALGHGVAGAT